MGLYYFGKRYYDPEIIMWTSPDPMEQFWNSYSYCGSNPVNRIDIKGTYSPGVVDKQATKRGTNATEMIKDLAKNLVSDRGMSQNEALQTACEILGQLGAISLGGNIVFDPGTAAFLVEMYKERQALLKEKKLTLEQEKRLKEIEEQVKLKVDQLIERLNKAKENKKTRQKLFKKYKKYQKHFNLGPKTPDLGAAGRKGNIGVDDIRPDDTYLASDGSGGDTPATASFGDTDADKY